MFWNSITDHTIGKQSRKELITNWNSLIERHIFFLQGTSNNILSKLTLPRIHFAFLDGAHTFENVMFEFNYINNSQKRGDVIVFDDYNVKSFPGIVKAVNFISKNMNYEIRIIKNFDTHRDYVIAEKK